MEKLFELTFQDQTLTPQVGTFTDVSQTTGTFTLEDGEYYLTNGDTKGFYAYAPIAIQPDSETDNKVTVEFDLKVATASANTHTIIGTYAGVDGSGIPTGAKITLQYTAGDIELVLGSGTTATLIAAADVVVDQWYHFRIDCALDAPTESTYEVKIDGTTVTTVTGATTDYELGIISVLGTDLHACDECGIKNIRLITNDDYFVGRTALNQAFTDTKGYVDNQVGACIPRTGGSVVTGGILGRVDDTGAFVVCGGPTETDGASITLVGKNRGLLDGTVGLTANNGAQTSGVRILPDGTIIAIYPDATVKNVAMREDVVPRFGGAVMTGDTLGRNVDNGAFTINGGTAWNAGGSVSAYGKDNPTGNGEVRIHASNGVNIADYYFYPNGNVDLGANFAFNNTDISIRIGDSAAICTVLKHDGVYWSGANQLIPLTNLIINLGSAGNAWKDCYLANAPVIVSDARAKTKTQDVDDKLLDAWSNIEIKTYKMISAVEKKGEKARYHIGYIAQDIQAECEKQGVNASDYGLFCYDEWDEQEEVSEEIETEKDGKIIKEKRVIQPKREKGNSYALRYEEALVVECKYLRRCIERLTARIEQLEKEREVSK